MSRARQTRFGPTRKALSELMDIRMYAGPNTYVRWMQKQMQLPYSSHRFYLRERVMANRLQDGDRAGLAHETDGPRPARHLP